MTPDPTREQHPGGSDTERVYNWSAPLDGQVMVTADDVKRWGWDPETEKDWDSAVRHAIGQQGGPPSDIDWPTKIERVR